MTTPVSRPVHDKKTKIYRTPLSSKLSKQLQAALNEPKLKIVSLKKSNPKLIQSELQSNNSFIMKKSFEEQSPDDFEEYSDNYGDFDTFSSSLGFEISNAPLAQKSPQKSSQLLPKNIQKNYLFFEHLWSFLVFLMYIVIINTIIRGYFTSSWNIWPF